MSEHLNKIPKETLTIQNIKQDIKEIYKPSIPIFFVFGILGAILLLLAGEFCFAKGGKYRIYLHTAASFENRHYKWSKMYNMSNQGIYNYSHIDDDFYLVFSNDKKNNLLLIYNKKLFDLKEN